MKVNSKKTYLFMDHVSVSVALIIMLISQCI